LPKSFRNQKPVIIFQLQLIFPIYFLIFRRTIIPTQSMAEELPSPIGNYAFRRSVSTHEFWSVWEGENTLTQSLVCIKVISKSALSSLERRTRSFREFESLLELRHPFIVDLYETLEDPSNRYLIFEWGENGTFADFLNGRGLLNENTARVYFSQLIFALEYLHGDRTKFHTALMLDNIVLDRFNNIRLIDFGLRWQIMENKQYSAARLPPPWAAPEIIKGRPFSAASDVWAAGVFLYVMVAGVAPFGDSEEAVLSAEPSYQPTMSSALVDLLKRIFGKSDTRITIENIKRHHWFSQTQYNATLEAQFSQQRVNETVIDKDIVKRMAALRLDVRALPQLWIEREATPLTSLYRQFTRMKTVEAFGALMDQLTPQKQQQGVAFKFQFPGSARRPPLPPPRPQGDSGGTLMPMRVPLSRSGVPKDSSLPSPLSPGRAIPRTLAPASQNGPRRMSKPVAVRTLLPTQMPNLPGAAPSALDH
jgi:serine/threonine protein kinase